MNKTKKAATLFSAMVFCQCSHAMFQQEPDTRQFLLDNQSQIETECINLTEKIGIQKQEAFLKKGRFCLVGYKVTVGNKDMLLTPTTYEAALLLMEDTLKKHYAENIEMDLSSENLADHLKSKKPAMLLTIARSGKQEKEQYFFTFVKTISGKKFQCLGTYGISFLNNDMMHLTGNKYAIMHDISDIQETLASGGNPLGDAEKQLKEIQDATKKNKGADPDQNPDKK